MCRTLCFILLFLTCFSVAAAASCRAGKAAEAGKESGYNRAKAAAEAWAQRQKNVSSVLDDCLGNISTTITAPGFPNLTDVMNQIGRNICKAARNKINDYVPSTVDPWGDLPSTASPSSYNSLIPAIHSQPQPVMQMQTTTPTVSTTDNSSSPFISLN